MKRLTFLLSNYVYLLLCLGLTSGAVSAQQTKSAALEKLQQFNWYSGSEDCATAQAAPLEVFHYDESTVILRQSKCLHYEAPFLFLLQGEQQALLLDTGATENAEQFPLQKTITELLSSKNAEKRPLLVMHSHGHSDHRAADSQFEGQSNVKVVTANLAGVKRFLGYNDSSPVWPTDSTTIELGNREIRVFPLPGHSDDSIALYDAQTGWLLTGDSLYPGRLYVRDWTAYKNSIARLVQATQTLNITAVLGTHIEMSNMLGVDYPTGSTWHPDEAPWLLEYRHLLQLNDILTSSHTPERIKTDRFIVYPLN